MKKFTFRLMLILAIFIFSGIFISTKSFATSEPTINFMPQVPIKAGGMNWKVTGASNFQYNKTEKFWMLKGGNTTLWIKFNGCALRYYAMGLDSSKPCKVDIKVNNGRQHSIQLIPKKHDGYLIAGDNNFNSGKENIVSFKLDTASKTPFCIQFVSGYVPVTVPVRFINTTMKPIYLICGPSGMTLNPTPAGSLFMPFKVYLKGAKRELGIPTICNTELLLNNQVQLYFPNGEYQVAVITDYNSADPSKYCKDKNWNLNVFHYKKSIGKQCLIDSISQNKSSGKKTLTLTIPSTLSNPKSSASKPISGRNL